MEDQPDHRRDRRGEADPIKCVGHPDTEEEGERHPDDQGGNDPVDHGVAGAAAAVKEAVETEDKGHQEEIDAEGAQILCARRRDLRVELEQVHDAFRGELGPGEKDDRADHRKEDAPVQRLLGPFRLARADILGS